MKKKCCLQLREDKDEKYLKMREGIDDKNGFFFLYEENLTVSS